MAKYETVARTLSALAKVEAPNESRTDLPAKDPHEGTEKGELLVRATDIQVLKVHHERLDLRAREVHAIMGPSGVGKTSIMEVLALRRRTHYSGDIRFFDPAFETVCGGSLQSGTYISWVEQYPQKTFLDNLTVGETLDYALRLRDGGDPKDSAEHICRKFLLDGKEGTKVKFLSGGQVKRLALAVGMLRKPKLLMADEPLSGLAEVDAIRSIRSMYEFANYEGANVFLSLHQPSSACLMFVDVVSVISHAGVCKSYDTHQSAGAVGADFEGFAMDVQDHALVEHAAIVANVKAGRRASLEGPADVDVDEILGHDDKLTPMELKDSSTPAERMRPTVRLEALSRGGAGTRYPVETARETWTTIVTLFRNDKQNLARKAVVKMICFLVTGSVFDKANWNVNDTRIMIACISVFTFFFATESIDVYCVWYERQPWLRNMIMAGHASAVSMFTAVLAYDILLIRCGIIAPVGACVMRSLIGFHSQLPLGVFVAVGVVLSLTWNVFALAMAVGSFDARNQFGLAAGMINLLTFLGGCAATSGLFVPYDSSPSYLAWLYHLNPFGHAVFILNHETFRGRTIKCGPTVQRDFALSQVALGEAPDVNCPLDGTALLESIGQTGTYQRHWWSLCGCLLGAFAILAMVVLRETNPLPAPRAPRVVGPLKLDRLKLSARLYWAMLLLPTIALAVAATLKFPRHYDVASNVELYSFVRPGRGSVTAAYPAHPGTVRCESLGAAKVIDWYVRAEQQLKGSQLLHRAQLPPLDPPVLDNFYEQTTTCCGYLEAGNAYEAGRQPQRDLTLAELQSFYPRGAMTTEDAAARTNRFYDDGGDGLTLSELFSVQHAPALRKLDVVANEDDLALVGRLAFDPSVSASLEAAAGGASLLAAAGNGRVYAADYTFLSAVADAGAVTPGYNVSAPLAVFFEDSRGLRTVAIEMRSVDADPASPVDRYTAMDANPTDWLYARLRLRHAAYVTQGLYHVASLHAAPVAVFSAAHVHLDQNHPVTEVLSELIERGAIVSCGVETTGDADAGSALAAPGGASMSSAVYDHFDVDIRGDYTLWSSMLWVTNSPNNLRVGGTTTIQALCDEFPILETWNFPRYLAKRNMGHLDLVGSAVPRASMLKVWDAALDLATQLMKIGRPAGDKALTEAEKAFLAAVVDRDGANLAPAGPLETTDDMAELVATVLFQKLTHSMTRCYMLTAPIFMNKLAMPSTLRNLPAGKPNLATVDEIAHLMAGSRDTVDDMGVTGAALSFPAQNIWHEDRQPLYVRATEVAYYDWLVDLKDTMGADDTLKLFLPCMEVGADV